jgi:hypothetical protein
MSKDITSLSFFRFALFVSSFLFSLFMVCFASDLTVSLRFEISKKNYFFHVEAKKYEYFMRGTKGSTTEEERDVGVIISSNLKPAA